MNPFSIHGNNQDESRIQGNLNLSPRKPDPSKKRNFNGRTYTHELPRPQSESLSEILVSPTKRRQVELTKPQSDSLSDILISPTKRRQEEHHEPVLRRIPFSLDDQEGNSSPLEDQDSNSSLLDDQDSNSSPLDDQDGNSSPAEIRYVEGPKAKGRYIEGPKERNRVVGYVEDFQVPDLRKPKATSQAKLVDRRLCPFLTSEERSLLDKLETRVPLTKEELFQVGIDVTKAAAPEEEFQHLPPLYNRHIEDDENHPFVMARFIKTHASSMIGYAVTVNKAVLYPRETTQLPFSLLVSPENGGMICILLNRKGRDQRTFSGGFKIGKFGIDAATGVKYLFSGSSLEVSDTVRHGILNEYRRVDELTGQVFANCLLPVFCYEYPKKSDENRWLTTIPTKVGFATRFIPGGDLGRAIAKKKIFSIHEVCCIARGILNGLSSLHKQGLLHLDVNPNNVLLDIIKGNIKDAHLIDFGNMQKIGDWSNFCTHLHYASPEWLYELVTRAVRATPPTIFVDEWDEGRKYDAYSAGLTLHMLLNSISTDVVPWLPQNQSTEYLRAHIHETIATREEWHSQLPEGDPLQRIVKGLTHPDPTVRMSVDQALGALNSFIDMIS